MISFDQFLVLCFVYQLSGQALSAECVKKMSCSCTMNDGSGEIDLASVASSYGKKPVFSDIIGTDGNLYFYNPCTDFTLKDSAECKEAALCFYDKTAKVYKSLGTVESARFGQSSSDGVITLLYSHEAPPGVVTTEVRLKCTDQSDEFSSSGAVNSTFYNATLASKCACVNGCVTSRRLSTGSLLLVVTACLVVTYLTVGMLYNRSVIGAQGRYIIPHWTFWSELPSLVKDGYWFFISPCLGDRVEYRHYERL